MTACAACLLLFPINLLTFVRIGARVSELQLTVTVFVSLFKKKKVLTKQRIWHGSVILESVN